MRFEEGHWIIALEMLFYILTHLGRMKDVFDFFNYSHAGFAAHEDWDPLEAQR